MTEKKKPNPYEKCKLFVENESCCGPFKHWNKDGMFVIDQLKACVHYFLPNFYFSPNDSPLKTMKNVFYFI